MTLVEPRFSPFRLIAVAVFLLLLAGGAGWTAILLLGEQAGDRQWLFLLAALGAAFGVLLLLLLEMASLRITDDHLERRVWGRRVRLRWQDVERPEWDGPSLIVRSGRKRIVVHPNLYRNGGAIAQVIQREARRRRAPE
jgi:hypothetical protein